MVFNPLFLQQHTSEEGKNVVKPARLQNSNYIFSDIIKVYSADEQVAADAVAEKSKNFELQKPQEITASAKSTQTNKTYSIVDDNDTLAKYAQLYNHADSIRQQAAAEEPEDAFAIETGADEDSANQVTGITDAVASQEQNQGPTGNTINLLEQMNAKPSAILVNPSLFYDQVQGSAILQNKISGIQAFILNAGNAAAGSSSTEINNAATLLKSPVGISGSSLQTGYVESSVLNPEQLANASIDTFSFETFFSAPQQSTKSSGSANILPAPAANTASPSGVDAIKAFNVQPDATEIGAVKSSGNQTIATSGDASTATGLAPSVDSKPAVDVSGLNAFTVLKPKAAAEYSNMQSAGTNATVNSTPASELQSMVKVASVKGRTATTAPGAETANQNKPMTANEAAAVIAKFSASAKLPSVEQNDANALGIYQAMQADEAGKPAILKRTATKNIQSFQEAENSSETGTKTAAPVANTKTVTATAKTQQSENNSEASAQPKAEGGKSAAVAQNNQAQYTVEENEPAAATTVAEPTVLSIKGTSVESLMEMKLKTAAINSDTVTRTLKSSEIFTELRTTILSHDKQKVVYSLEPESLGKMRLLLETTQNSVSAHIEVETDAARRAVEANLQQLRQSLSQDGLQHVSIQVSLRNQEQKQPRNGTQRKRMQTVGQPVFEGTEVQAASKQFGYNTYEYLA